MDAEPKMSPWHRMPPYRRILLVALAIAVLVMSFWSDIRKLFVSMLPKTATIQVVDVDDNPIALVGRADVFELDRTKYLSSPRPLLASVELDGLSDVLTLNSEQFPRSLQVRFHIPGYGVDYASVELGKRRAHKLRLGPPTAVTGVVLGKGGSPLEGAKVVALGIAARGVVVSESVSNQQGRFELIGISQRVGMLVLRVLKEGYAMKEREHALEEFAIDRLRNTTFRMKPTPPIRGVVRFPTGFDRQGVRVSVLNIAGVSTAITEDGSFTLHYLDTGKRYRLLLQGLPQGYAHGSLYGRCGERVEIVVGEVVTVTGTVVSKSSGSYVAGAKLWHNYSTHGIESVYTGPAGRFTLRSVPRGEHFVTIETPKSPTFPEGGVEIYKILADGSANLVIEVQ